MRCSTWVDVDLSRIIENYRSVERLTGKRVIAIVKANAYGHGMVSVATGLAAHVKDLMVGVGTPEEAIELRESGYSQRILVMGFSQPEILHRVLPLDCEFAVWDRVQIARMSQEANRLNLRAKAHLYIDMDMGRFGCSAANAAELVQAILDVSGLQLSGVIEHLPSVAEAF